MQKLFKLIVYSNIWIASGAAMLAALTMVQLKLELNWRYLWFVFFATLCSYTLQRYYRHNSSSKTDGERQGWLVQNRVFLLSLLVLSALSSAWFALGIFQLKHLYWLIPIGFLSLFYSIQLPRTNKGFRDVPFLKIVFIAISWALLTGPMSVVVLEEVQFVSYELLLITTERFLFILAITIPFDIRDLPFDDPSKRTIPQLFGIKNSVRLSLSLLLVCLALFVLLMMSHSTALVVGVSTYVFLLFVVGRIKGNESELYYSGLIDGSIILLSGSLLLALALN